MKEKNLYQNSSAYYENNDYYEIFSRAEDGEGKVTKYLMERAKDKIVLDAGCGTGKFLNILENVASKYIGVDLSFDQLIKAQMKRKKESSSFINANLKDLMLADDSIDLIISPWVLGTVLDIKEREECLHELKRVLKPGGKIILIENDEGSEFETLRNRDKDLRTRDYNDWIISNDFNIAKQIDTKFIFNSFVEARNCFLEIYGDDIANKIKSEIIEHKIILFEFVKGTTE